MRELVQRLNVESGLAYFVYREDLPLKSEYGRTLCQDDTEDLDERCNQRVFDQLHEDLEGSDFCSEGAVNPCYAQIPCPTTLGCRISVYNTGL